jgi:hypothetical protein
VDAGAFAGLPVRPQGREDFLHGDGVGSVRVHLGLQLLLVLFEGEGRGGRSLIRDLWGGAILRGDIATAVERVHEGIQRVLLLHGGRLRLLLSLLRQRGGREARGFGLGLLGGQTGRHLVLLLRSLRH